MLGLSSYRSLQVSPVMKRSKNKYLLVCYGRSHAKTVKILADLLPNENTVVLPLLTAKDEFKDEQYNKIDLWSFTAASELEEAVNIGGEILVDHYNPHSGIDELESLRYLGLSFRDSEQFYGKAKWQKKYSEIGRQAFLPINTMKSIFREVQPTALITTNSPRAERAAQMVASGVCTPSVIFTDLFSGVPYYKMAATYINFLNKKAFNFHDQLGQIDHERSSPMFFGNPLFISAFEALNLTPSQYSCSLETTKVLHIDSHSYLDCSSRKSVFRTIDDTLAEVFLLHQLFGQLGLELVWRPHPAQVTDQLIERISNRDIAIDLTPIELLDPRSFRFIVGRNSTALLELLLRGARLIQIDPHLHSDIPLVEMGVASGKLITSTKKIDMFEMEDKGLRERVVDALNLHPENLIKLQTFLQEGLFVNA